MPTAMQPEYRVVRKIQQALKAHGAFVFKIHGSAHMQAGLPDLIVCWQGRFYALEVKRPQTQAHVSAMQRHVIGLVEKAGGVAGVVCSVPEALHLVGIRASPPRTP